jgi:hypothetical protein
MSPRKLTGEPAAVGMASTAEKKNASSREMASFVIIKSNRSWHAFRLTLVECESGEPRTGNENRRLRSFHSITSFTVEKQMKKKH